jgi:ATP citrate (pro-S)-lyase
LEFPQIKALALIAEGVPERHAREIPWKAQEKGVLIIGPATVAGVLAASGSVTLEGKS